MGYIEVRQTRGVGLITLNRPEKLNAFVGRMREDLLAGLTTLEASDSVRVIVLLGAGRGFCAGGDVGAMQRLREHGDVAEFARILDAANAVVQRLEACCKPTVAAVHGPAAGGGANLALACDIRLGSPNCSFTQSFVRIGLGPDWGGSVVLPRIVGMDRARELLLTGRRVDAEEAARLGLVHRLVAAEKLVSAVRETAGALAGASPHAVEAIKSTVRQGQRSLTAALEHERSAQLRCFLSDEAYAGFQRFARRKELAARPKQELNHV